ncbi:dynein regulatory complex protein 10-like [Ischnura elegans]|uniref:dynein regulatory complex protein 10-like n=1 Tax=Ischnura elegans TaxID=197161 RepID=UPI001ED888BF|nr:dynein regulatory complex protein 10-like [Ischnura elegans]
MGPSESNTDDEADIGRSRILKILDETIEKIELALCLPLFIKNLDRFANHLSEDELEILSKEIPEDSENLDTDDASKNENYAEEIKRTPSSESLESLPQIPMEGKNAHKSKDELKTFARKMTVDINVKKAIDMMRKRPDLVNVAKAEYLSCDKESPGLVLIENMRAVRQNSLTRLEDDRTPDDEKRELLHYNHLWHKNDEALAKIKALKPILNKWNTRIQDEQEGKDKIINEMKNRMKKFENDYQEEIEKICADSEKNMVVESKSSEERQAVINKEINSLDEKFQNTLTGHLKTEKELRVKRYKTENQFEVCLNTYDNDMGEKQSEYDEILEGYQEEQKEMESLQVLTHYLHILHIFPWYYSWWLFYAKNMLLLSLS